MEKHRVYLDTNIISRIFDSRLSQEDADALQALSNRDDVTLVASSAARSELEKTRDPKRRALLGFASRLFNSLPWETVEISGTLNSAPLNTMALNSSWRHPLLTALEATFDPADAMHIAQARLSSCRFLLTLDRRTILNRVPMMSEDLRRQLHPLELCAPEELINRLEK
jgi:predicted nucleic acid-binding protein